MRLPVGVVVANRGLWAGPDSPTRRMGLDIQRQVDELTTAYAAADAALDARLDALEANYAKGLVAAPASITSNSSAFTTVADVSGLSVTWTAVASRRYRLVFNGDVASDTSGDVITASITTSGNTQLSRGTARMNASNVAETVHAEAFITGVSGSVTYKVRAERTSGAGSCTVQAAATYPAIFYVEDVGV
jgi:hypothetical protein